MDKSEIIRIIEGFAPPELAESWDCSGWIAETNNKEIERVLLALTVTEDVIHQAKNKNCDMIISHHPLFCVPLSFREKFNGDIYCAHTNLDRTKGGTTDELINILNINQLSNISMQCNHCETEFNGEAGVLPLQLCENSNEGFLRYINMAKPVAIGEFTQILKRISPNLRYVNNKKLKNIQKIAFCAGSGTDFIEEATRNGASAFVTGDSKFHTALDSEIVIFDIGHFESEIPVLKVFERLLSGATEIIFAEEQSPFSYP